MVAEASVAGKQREGRWAEGYAAAAAAIRDADAVICLNPDDVAGVRSVRPGAAPPDSLPPFIDVVACGMLRAWDSSSAIACSAAESALEPAALHTTMPRRVQAGTSTVS